MSFHKFYNISTEVLSAYNTGPSVAPTLTYQGSFDFSSADLDNTFLLFKYKHTGFDLTNVWRIEIRYGDGSDPTSGNFNFRADQSTPFYDYFFDYYTGRFNFDTWTDLKISFKDFDYATGTACFDISSMGNIRLRSTAINSGDTYTVSVKDLCFEFGTDISSDDITFTLVGSGSGDALKLYPEFDYEADQENLETNLRLLNGDHYSYKSGDFKRYKFSANYVPTSVANAVNSLWNTNALSIFQVYQTNSNHAVELEPVKVMGRNRPFKKFTKTYIDLMDGKIQLETYES